MSRKLTTNEFIEKSNIIHSNGKYDYSKVNYKNNHTKIKIICNEHGSFWQTPRGHIIEKQGYPTCGIKKRTELLKSNTEEFIKKSNLVHNFKYNYSKVDYNNARIKVCIICSDHGEFWQSHR